MFFDSEIQKLYKRGLALTDDKHSKQKQFRNSDERLAVHLALAYMYCEKFGFGHVLFDAFWKDASLEQHKNFVSFLGRSFISGDNANANELLKKEPESKRRLKKLWSWMLDNCEDSKPFTEFGFWIDLKKDIYEPAWLADKVRKTLEKTKGLLNWNRGLIEIVVLLAQKAPEDTLVIARQYLLEGGVRGNARRRPFCLDDEWIKAFEILYKNQKTKLGIETLINELVREGGDVFYSLKNTLKNN